MFSQSHNPSPAFGAAGGAGTGGPGRGERPYSIEMLACTKSLDKLLPEIIKISPSIAHSVESLEKTRVRISEIQTLVRDAEKDGGLPLEKLKAATQELREQIERLKSTREKFYEELSTLGHVDTKGRIILRREILDLQEILWGRPIIAAKRWNIAILEKGEINQGKIEALYFGQDEKLPTGDALKRLLDRYKVTHEFVHPNGSVEELVVVGVSSIGRGEPIYRRVDPFEGVSLPKPQISPEELRELEGG